MLYAGAIQADSQLRLESGPGHAGPVGWQAVSLDWSPSGDDRATAGWRLTVDELQWRDWQGSLRVACARGGLKGARPWCRQGRFEWLPADGGSALAGKLTESGGVGGIGFEMADGRLIGHLDWPPAGAPEGLRASLQLRDFELSALPGALVDSLGLSFLQGRSNGRIELSEGRLAFELDIADGGFDRPDGLVAGGGLALSVTGEVGGLVGAAQPNFDVSLSQRAGELLAGPIYLPPPDAPLALELAGALRHDGRLVVDELVLEDGGLANVHGALALEPGPEGWRPVELVVDRARFELPGAWNRWGEGIASARGFGGLDARGRIEASLAWRSGRLESLAVEFEEVGLRDSAGRFAVDSVDGSLRRSTQALAADLSWEGIELFKLAFGASRLLASGAPGDWRLSNPLELPLLDGAVVIDRLIVGADDGGAQSLTLDARIEPLDLARLTQALGWPTFGGELSGRFPGIRVSGDRVAFSGGIDVRAFSGGIRLDELVIERPFGTLPALAAQVAIERLDLAELTGAFNFGHMEGELSGWLRDLRLLDWQPVAMDARLFAHEDAPSRRISQRAVENLSRLGGGAAAIGATLLRVFEEFPYRRAGLACRLDRNICHIDGVGPHESGGFYIVEGRGLPHLDVVGHRRLVDWPRLVAQLVAMTKG
ncbi:MAG: hypothetical protein GVY11_07785 [Gammaproteobacteria bacterium]|nr:hypothetical protein [Gammaproteobacteria bacterium]